MKKSSLLVSTLLILLTSASGFAKPLPDALQPVNAYSLGMGMTGVALPHNPAILYWNPAGMAAASLSSADISAAAPRFEGPGNWSVIVANSSPDDDRHFGMAMVRRSVESDSIIHKSFQLGVPLSYSLFENALPVGFSIKWISESYQGAKWKYGLAFDVGAILKLGAFKVGFASQNIGGSDLRDFRRRSYLGGSFRTSGGGITLSSQTELLEKMTREKMKDNYGLGVGLHFWQSIPELTLGQSEQGGERWLTAGLSYRYPKNNNRISYAFAYDAGDHSRRVHIFTYSIGSPVLETGRSGM